MNTQLTVGSINQHGPEPNQRRQGGPKIALRGGGGGMAWAPGEGGGGGSRNGLLCQALCFV